MESAVLAVAIAIALTWYLLYRKETYIFKIIATWLMWAETLYLQQTNTLNNILGMLVMIIFLIIAVHHTAKLVID